MRNLNLQHLKCILNIPSSWVVFFVVKGKKELPGVMADLLKQINLPQYQQGNPRQETTWFYQLRTKEIQQSLNAPGSVHAEKEHGQGSHPPGKKSACLNCIVNAVCLTTGVYERSRGEQFHSSVSFDTEGTALKLKGCTE